MANAREIARIAREAVEAKMSTETMQVPTNSIEFERMWKRVKANPEKYLDFLASVPPKRSAGWSLSNLLSPTVSPGLSRSSRSRTHLLFNLESSTTPLVMLHFPVVLIPNVYLHRMPTYFKSDIDDDVLSAIVKCLGICANLTRLYLFIVIAAVSVS